MVYEVMPTLLDTDGRDKAQLLFGHPLFAESSQGFLQVAFKQFNYWRVHYYRAVLMSLWDLWVRFVQCDQSAATMEFGLFLIPILFCEKIFAYLNFILAKFTVL